MSSRQKDVRRLLTHLQTTYGCRVVSNGHHKVTRPGHKGVVVVSQSPRSPEVLKAVRADIFRVFGIDVRDHR